MAKEINHIAFLKQHLKGFDDIVKISIGISLLCVVYKIAEPILKQILIDDVLSGVNPDWGAPLIFFVIFLTLFDTVLRLVESLTWRQRLGMAISSKSEMFWHAIRLPVGFYQDKYAGDIAGRINFSTQIIKSLDKIFYILEDALLIVFYLYFMIKYNLYLSGLAILDIAITLYITKRVNKKIKQINVKKQKDSDILQGITAASIGNIDAIKASAGEKSFLNRWTERFSMMQRSEIDANSSTLKLGTVPLFIEAISTVLVLGIGAKFIMSGYMTVGMLMSFQSFMTAFMNPVNHFTKLQQDILNINVKVDRMDEVLSAECDVPDELSPVSHIVDDKLSGELELRHVTFGYDRNLPPIIEDFNMHIKPGQSVAFVGGSGSGKSTLAKLISGIIKPWSGEILFDGQPLEKINRDVFANSVSIIDQNIVLFDGSIEENIKMWDDSIENYVMIFASHQAQIHNDIVIRKNSYDSAIENGGKNFSGGQRQRIELATAFAKEPTFIIMDEGTSALDAITENTVMTNMRNMGCSQIIIAHRLSTIRDCNEIIVLRNGKVVERGTHEELIKNKGYYCHLVEN